MCSRERHVCPAARANPDHHRIQREARIEQVVCKTIEGYSAREIAEHLDVSERQVVRDRAYARDNGWFEEVS